MPEPRHRDRGLIDTSVIVGLDRVPAGELPAELAPAWRSTPQNPDDFAGLDDLIHVVAVTTAPAPQAGSAAPCGRIVAISDLNTPETLTFSPSGEIPNSALPVLVYRDSGLVDPATAERTFADRDWRGSWRDGIYPFHHFHSIAHEVLAIVSGEVTLVLGGEDGQTLTAGPGDVLVLPAGTGHCRTGASADLLVVGAYPGGMEWDICRGDPAQRERVARNLARVPLPSTDPLHGADGALTRLWNG